MTTRFRGTYADDQSALHDAVKAAAGNRCVRCNHPSGDRMHKTEDVNFVIELEAIHGSAAHVKEIPEGWRVMVFERCDDRCTHPKLPPKMRVLTVHHLDGNKSNNLWWNLLALCQVCHLNIQGKVIPSVPYLWKHSAWFVPYVCGFYAHYYGRFEISRWEADAEPDKWLKLGQPWLYAK